MTESPTRILVTGPPGAGKTTLIKNISQKLMESGKIVAGFYTEEIRQASKRTGFDIVTLDKESVRGQLARIENAGSNTRAPKVGQYTVLMDDFERISLTALEQNKVNHSDFIIIDEIGKIECFSRRFQSVVRALYSTNKNIISTIPLSKGKPLPLVEELSSRSDTSIMTVSKENRDYLGVSVLKTIL